MCLNCLHYKSNGVRGEMGEQVPKADTEEKWNSKKLIQIWFKSFIYLLPSRKLELTETKRQTRAHVWIDNQYCPLITGRGPHKLHYRRVCDECYQQIRASTDLWPFLWVQNLIIFSEEVGEFPSSQWWRCRFQSLVGELKVAWALQRDKEMKAQEVRILLVSDQLIGFSH